MRIAIFGGGISGLAAGWFLRDRLGPSVDITLFEASERLGGWIKSRQVEGAIFEEGPHSLRAVEGPLVVLLARLGLERLYAHVEAKKRYLYYQGALCSLHAPSFWPSMGYALAKDFITGKTRVADESVHSFFSRRFGAFTAEYFADALVKGIFACDARHLSMAMAFPALWEADGYGAFWRAPLFSSRNQGSIFTLKRGLESLPKALATHFPGNIHLQEPVDKVWMEKGKVICVTSHGTYSFDGAVDSRSPKQALPYTTVAMVQLAYYEKIAIPHGFGYLVPSKEQLPLWGVIFDSELFPEQNGPFATRLTVLLPDCPDKEEVAHKMVKEHLAIHRSPEYLYSGVAHEAIPRYPLFHKNWVKEIDKGRDPLVFTGTAYEGVSVGQVVARSEKVVGTLIARLV